MNSPTSEIMLVMRNYEGASTRHCLLHLSIGSSDEILQSGQETIPYLATWALSRSDLSPMYVQYNGDRRCRCRKPWGQIQSSDQDDEVEPATWPIMSMPASCQWHLLHQRSMSSYHNLLPRLPSLLFWIPHHPNTTSPVANRLCFVQKNKRKTYQIDKPGVLNWS